ncbi:MAG TPA: flagellar biosynthetic protein FliR [Gemmataceae bacterium]|nr:flagellar biosynthetic protein FliR [Gemmataceae bacterium]
MIDSLVLSFSLILARTGAFVSVLPLLGGRSTPHTVKVGLAVALAVLYFMLLGGKATPPALVDSGPVSWLCFGMVVVKEVLLGGFLGYVMGLVLLPVQIAGDYLGQEMGLALAAQADPTATNPSLVVSQLFQMLAGILFLGLNGHHLFLAALHSTFQYVPLGGWSGFSAAEPMTAGLASAHEWGLMLAAPVGALLFLSSIILALINRAAPQMNLFSVGFGLRIGLGLAALFLLMPDFVKALVRSITHMSALLERLV